MGRRWKQRNIGVAPASYCVNGGSPRISSIVRTMLAVLYSVLSTERRRHHGLITSPAVRCASTWSGPFCASSSITKIAISRQKRLREAAATIFPSATSLLATAATGVARPGVVPLVWSSPSDMIVSRGSVPVRSAS